MKLYLICAVLIAAPSVFADKVIDINNGTDQALIQVNKFLTKHGLGLHPLPPIIYKDIRLFEGVIVGLNSQYRTRDSTIRLDEVNNATSLDLHLGLRLYSLGFGKLEQENVSCSAVIRVRNNSFHIAFTVNTNRGCSVNLTHYEYEELSGASLSASVAGFDEVDVSANFENVVLPRINEVIARKKPRIQRAIQRLVCRRPHPHHYDHEEMHQKLSEIFVSLFEQ